MLIYILNFNISEYHEIAVNIDVKMSYFHLYFVLLFISVVNNSILNSSSASCFYCYETSLNVIPRFVDMNLVLSMQIWSSLWIGAIHDGIDLFHFKLRTS